MATYHLLVSQKGLILLDFPNCMRKFSQVKIGTQKKLLSALSYPLAPGIY